MEFRRDQQYEGFILNPAVKKGKENIKVLQDRIDREQQEIDKAQAACDHIYLFYATGTREDHFICMRCGKQAKY